MKKILLKILGLWFVRILIGVFVIFIVLFFLEAANASSVIVSQYNTLYDNTIPQASTLKSDFMDYAEVVSEMYDNSAQKKQMYADKLVKSAYETYASISTDIRFPDKYVTSKNGTINGSVDEPLMALYFAQWFDKLRLAKDSKYNSSYRPANANYDNYDFGGRMYYSDKCRDGEAGEWCAIFASCIFSEAQIGVTRQVLPFDENCMRQLAWFINNEATVAFRVDNDNDLKYTEVIEGLPKFGCDETALANAQASGRVKVDPSYTPKAGDIMYCVDPRNGTGPYYASHVVIVLEYSENDGLTTLEGNIGGGNANLSQMKLKRHGDTGQYMLTSDRNCIFVTPKW